MIGRTCFPKRYRRSSRVFFDQQPDFTAENAVQRSLNVVIASPRFTTLPVYSFDILSQLLLGLVFWHRSRSQRLFLLRAHATALRVGRPKMEESYPDLPFAAAFDLSDPALGRLGFR